MPSFPILDTHVHLTNLERASVSVMKDIPSLNRSFDLGDYSEACGPVDVGEIVFMEVCCDAPDLFKEVAWVTELSETDPRLTGIVAQAPLEQGDRVVDILTVYAKNPLVKGVRRVLQQESPDFCLQEEFLRGLGTLSEFDYSFDICIHHAQLASTIKMVEQCPGVRFILDHIAKPDIKAGLFDPWKSELKVLAGFPNVVCKISGMTTEADHNNWTRDDLRPYIDQVVECFGFDRIIHGGDWFVSSLATTIPRWIETLDWAMSGCTENELRKFYVENGRAFYRLGTNARTP